MKNKKSIEQNVEVFFRVSGLLHRLVDRHFKYDVGKITIQQVKAVEEVFYCGGDGINLKDLAERLDISSSAASQVVESLVQEELLLRMPSRTDRRAVVITISPKVAELHRQHLHFFEELLGRSLAEVPAHEIGVALRVLNVLLSNLEKETKQK